MNSNVLFLAMLAGAASAEKSDHWAVLVAGSKSWYNYGQQADTCHAYQILKSNGVPEEQIIHMAYDDIANHENNPFPGKIFNANNTHGPGVDVYAGCKIDYKGNDVTAETLFKVLAGNKSANGPVLGSDENSRIFFYYSDHGGAGLVAMPVGGRLYADALNKAVKDMHTNNKYKSMNMYVSACYSGSMFENILDDNINVYAMTASNAHQCGLMQFCPVYPDYPWLMDDIVDGKHMATCLGTEWSNAWMQDSDKADMATETIATQFTAAVAGTNYSQASQYGQLSLASEPIGNFQSGTVVAGEKKGDVKTELTKNSAKVERGTGGWSIHDNRLNYCYSEVMRDPTEENQQALSEEIARRTRADKVFAEAFPTLKNLHSTPAHIKFDCYKKLMNDFENICFELEGYSLKYSVVLAQQCEVIAAFPQAAEATIATLTKTCATNII